MIEDLQGNPMTGATPESADDFAAALAAFNCYRGDPVGLLDRAVEASPGFAIAHILKAYLFGLATEPAATAEARAVLARIRTLDLDERERSHVDAIEALVAGNWTRAAETLESHNIRYPRDLVGIQAGHLIDFYRASARGLRDRIARILPLWSADMPGYHALMGMYAFGLEEAGDYQRAEELGRSAIEMQPLDSWAHHAVAHVMEMQGRAEDGIGWMIAREPYWAEDGVFFRIHNWWHRTLYHIDLGQMDQALALYDGPIRGERSAVALNMLDASALLWRLHLSGADPGRRWNELADAWDAHSVGSTYPFNDLHAAMAYLGAGRSSDVDRILVALRDADPDSSEAAAWALRKAVPLVEGFAAFWRGDHETAVDRLLHSRNLVNCFGGSHAQRDVIDWTLTEAAIRGGLPGIAEALANERLALKPHSPVNRNFLERARASAGGA